MFITQIIRLMSRPKPGIVTGARERVNEASPLNTNSSENQSKIFKTQLPHGNC